MCIKMRKGIYVLHREGGNALWKLLLINKICTIINLYVEKETSDFRKERGNTYET